MIERYTKKEIGDIWIEDSTYQTWLEVELSVCHAWVKLGKISEEVFEDIKSKVSFNVDRIHEIEKEVKHDVIAFLTCVAENVGEKSWYAC
jgi:adenylosuccinate lyase